MPIIYSIDKSHALIREVWTGKVSATDLASHWKLLLRDPEALALRRTLADLRNGDIAFSGEQLSDMIRTIAEPALHGRDWRTALLVRGALQFGVSRQYQSLAQVYSDDAIFRDEDAALRWLVR